MSLSALPSLLEIAAIRLPPPLAADGASRGASTDTLTMWRSEHSIVTTATADRVWALWQDVESWPSWNAGVANIKLRGPFDTGSTFTMTLPDGDTIESMLIAVNPIRGFTDKTVAGDVLVVVDHALVPIADDRLRITFRTEVSGIDAAAVGQAVTEDFDEVLAALKQRAEAE